MYRIKRGKLITISMLLVAMMVAMSVLASGCDNKKDTWSYVSEKGVITIGVDKSFPPFTYTNDKDNLIGFDIDLATMAADILGLKVKHKIIPWKDKASALKDRKIDIIWGAMSKTPEREKTFLFSDAYLEASSVALVKVGSPLETLIDSNLKKIGVLESSSQHEYFKNNYVEGLEIVARPNQMKMIEEELVNGDLEAIISDNLFALFYVKHCDINRKVKIIDDKIGSHSYAVGMRKGDEILAQKLNGAIKEIIDSGRMDTLKTKWFGDSHATKSVNEVA